MLEGPMIVRIFLYGLILLEPQFSEGGEFDSIAANLLDDKGHEARLIYCTDFDGEACKEGYIKDPELKKEELITFEFLIADRAAGADDAEASSVELLAQSPPRTPRPFHCQPRVRPGKNLVLCDSAGAPSGKKYPWKPEEGSDYDWVVKVGDVLKPEDASSAPLGTHGTPFAQAVIKEGTVGACRFVTVPKRCLSPNTPSDEKVVPLVQFFGSDFPARAVADVAVVELVGTSAEEFVVRLKVAKDLELPARECKTPDGDPARCVELAITNLPPKGEPVRCGDDVNENLRMLAGTHWKLYYDFLGYKGEVKPYPIPVATDPGKPLKDVALDCPVLTRPGESKKIWTQQIVDRVHRLYPEDRPICPIGGP